MKKPSCGRWYKHLAGRHHPLPASRKTANFGTQKKFHVNASGLVALETLGGCGLYSQRLEYSTTGGACQGSKKRKCLSSSDYFPGSGIRKPPPENLPPPLASCRAFRVQASTAYPAVQGPFLSGGVPFAGGYGVVRRFPGLFFPAWRRGIILDPVPALGL